ncbi:MAG: hypothetical protein GF329_04470 [Candidatus Lokiarchaeota archaeon]|nr:hypothetical protein [Candidatus Lokiarchaeota archaeon]
MAIDNGNEKFLKLTELMSRKLAQRCSKEFVNAELQEIFNDRSVFISEIESLQNQINDYEQKIENLQQLKDYKSKYKEKEKKVSELEDIIDSMTSEDVEEPLQKVLDQNKELKSKIKLLNEENKELKKKITSNTRIRKNNEEKISALEKKIAELNNKVYHELHESQNLKKTLQEEREKIKTLNAEKKELKFAIRRLENRLLMNGRLMGLSIPVRSIEELPKEGESATQFQAELQRMRLELNKKTERIKTLEFEIKDLREKLDKSDSRDLQMENEHLKEKLEKKNSAILDFKTLRKKLVIQIKNLQNRITDLQDEVKIRTDELEEANKVIEELEIAVKTGVKDSAARDMISKLQEENHELRSEIRAMDTTIRAQNKTNFGYRNQVKSLKNQLAKLYNQSKWQLSQLHRYHDILRKSGIDPSDYGLDTSKITADFKKVVRTEGSSNISNELSQKDKKIRQLEKYLSELEKDMDEIKFRVKSRDVKINELEDIIKDIKIKVAKKGIKIKI